MKLLGRLFFPKAQPHEQRRNLRELAAAVILGVLLAAVVGCLIYFSNQRAH